MTETLVNEFINSSKIVIFSKTYCPYCSRVKQLFQSLNTSPKVIELDTREDGSAIQGILGKMTGASTVPRVFINGKFIGGCDGNILKKKKKKFVLFFLISFF